MALVDVRAILIHSYCVLHQSTLASKFNLFATYSFIFISARLTLFYVTVAGMSRKSRIRNYPWNSETTKTIVAGRYLAARTVNLWQQLQVSHLLKTTLSVSFCLQQECNEGKDTSQRKLVLDLLRSNWRYLLFKSTSEENEQLNSVR